MVVAAGAGSDAVWSPTVFPLSGPYLVAIDDSPVAVGATRQTGSGFDRCEPDPREGLRVADEIDPALLVRARQTLAEWMNAQEDGDGPPLVGDSFADWQVRAVEEFLVFSSPGGYTNRLYLVGDAVVRPFSFSTETEEYAVAAARAQRDGTEPPPPPPPAISPEDWNEQ